MTKVTKRYLWKMRVEERERKLVRCIEKKGSGAEQEEKEEERNK